jgi:hypothetical protein
MKQVFLQSLILVAIILLPICARAEKAQQTQPAATKEKSAAQVKSTQTAPAPQSQPADDDVPVMIEEHPQSKSSTTIATPPGLLETNIRRHNTYNRISKQAKDGVIQSRTAEEEAEAKKMDAENQPEEKKPPLIK